ncbi:hypothetical protein ERJ75_000075700 [Trypanosoma vivax]|uniref:Uncharacterized protein n=1 Tax=Trypanosoma vivax (strain Y486) TaxID=1055687 RepID=F9WTU2_TRYVY|nr:hypothetical protein ERJ75_000075700 [Trypanosoma vivax]CCD20988.1 hypothetical protein, conserved in T. vivax [Trypanosoma vivax Y486]|eukprot:CCD20988.1 hypothetical protein, conserved in T. vivax [Trypanosoma vivax Y486]
MVSKCFCCLLLFSVLWCDATASAHWCSEKRPLPREKVCATKDVLLGWMNVANKPALRAEAVMKNVSEIMLRARNIKAKAENLMTKYEKLLASLYPADYKEELAIIDQAIVDVNKSIGRANESELISKNALKAAEDSFGSSTICFNAIMRAAHVMWKSGINGKWNYTSVKATLDKHSVDCDEKYNISKILDSSTGDIDSVNLTEWKNKTLDILQKTYNRVELNKCDYHSTLWNDNKVEDVKKAVMDAVRHLEVAVHSFELSHTALNKAVNSLESASNAVQAANNSLLASNNAKLFCEIVFQFSKREKRLKTVKENVNGKKQNAGNALERSNRVHEDAKAAYKLVIDVAAWTKGDDLTLVFKWSGAHNLENAARNAAAAASGVASTSVFGASEASTSVKEIQNMVDTQLGLMRRVKDHLVDMNVAAGTGISDATFDACSNTLSHILKNKSTEAIRRIAKFNTSLLSELNVMMHKIDGEADATERNLSDLSNKVKEANSNAHDASLLAKQATENVKQIIVKVLSGIVTKLCATVGELRVLHNKAEAFSAHAAHAQKNISEWLLRVGDAERESDALVYLATSVEDAFATAEKRLEVLKRVLHRADEQRGKVAGELAASAVVAERSRNGATQVNKTLRDVLANITSRVSATFSKDVCNASLMSESLKLLSNMTDHPAVMSSLHVVAQLNRLADSMENQVLKGHRLMRVAGASSAQVDAALEEAIRMARERSGKPQCPALYRQLLGALGLHW